MLDLFIAPMMQWGQDATKSVSPDDVNNWNNWGYGMMGRHWGLVNGMMSWENGWILWVWQVLCLVTWFLVVLVLIALFRWLWKKGSK